MMLISQTICKFKNNLRHKQIKHGSKIIFRALQLNHIWRLCWHLWDFDPKFGWNISIKLYWEADGGEIINIETLDKNWFVQCREIKIANLKRGSVRVQWYIVQRQKKNFHKSVRLDLIYSFWRKLWVMWTSCLVFYIHSEKGCLEQYFLSMVGKCFFSGQIWYCVNVVITGNLLIAFAEIYVVFEDL